MTERPFNELLYHLYGSNEPEADWPPLDATAAETTSDQEVIEDFAQGEMPHDYQYQNIFRLALEPMVFTDVAGNIIEGNKAATQLLNVPQSFLHDLPFLVFFSAGTISKFQQLHRKLRNNQSVENQELPLKPARRDSIIVSVSAIRCMLPHGEAMLWQLRDITEQKRKEELLQQDKSILEDRVRIRTNELETAFREREYQQSLFTNIMASLTDGICVVGTDNSIQYMNEACEDLLGISFTESITLRQMSQQIQRNSREPLDLEAIWDNVVKTIATRPSFEIRLTRPQPRDLLLQLFPLPQPGTTAPGIGVVVHDVTASNRFAILEERDRIAMEIHDGAIQTLYATSLVLSAAIRSPDQTVAHMLETVHASNAHIADVIHQLRAAIYDLQISPYRLLSDALDSMIQSLWKSAGVTFDIVAESNIDGRQQPDLVFCLLAIAREAISNALRHGEPKHIWIRISSGNSLLEMTIKDDGRGFDPKHVSAGNGLKNMMERSEAIGGLTTVVSKTGNGTLVSVTLPA